MEGARETRRGVVKSSTFVKDIGIRRALRDIRNLVAEPSNACAISHKSKIGLHENKTTCVARRPVTRKFAATFASESQTSRQNKRIVKENQDEKSVSLLTSSNCLNICTEVDEDGTTVDEMEEMDQSGLKDVEMEDHTIYSFPDIDSCDSSNPLAVIEYVEDIYTFYRETEVASCASPDYMSQQFDINEKMRAILIDWLIEVHYKFELMDETIFLTVNIIDRFLERQTVARKKLQLVGVTAMLLACKYEEVSVPVVQDLVLISDRAYTREEILEMEIMILNTLQFNMSVPTPYVFMRRFLKAADSDKKLELLSFFIIELCLVEYKMVKFQPSLLAAAAIYTAHCTLQGYKYWNRTCEIHTTYSEDQLLECSRFMVDFHQNAGTGKLTGVHRKYSTFKYGCTTKLEPAHFLLNTDL